MSSEPERFRIWCGAAWTRRGWEWHWQVSDAVLRTCDRRAGAPGIVASGWQPSWPGAMQDAARYRRHIIAERVYLLWN